MKLKYVLLAVALTAGSITAAACGSSGEQSSFPGGVDSGSGDLGDGGSIGSLTGDSSTTSTTGSCTKLACKDLGATCGMAGDGCGGTIDCGGCTAPETCGGGGTPSVCGGTAGCIAKTCTELGVACGPSGDGCGGTIASCGTCTSPAICGGGGPSTCGGGDITDGGVFYADGGACVARTGCNPGECGPVADGCGGLLNCSSCPSGESCGGGGVASMCGAPACVKKTSCGTANCGYVADGCGGVINCGGSTSCTAPNYCGGGGANICGVITPTPVCTGFCKSQVTCSPATTFTAITGTVYAPNDTLPLPNALVYVPNGSTSYPYGLTSFSDGIGTGGTCDTCASEASGAPLVQTTSAYDGSFTLNNVPAGVPFPIVIQLGRWRKVVNVPAITKCTTYPVDPTTTRFPTIQNEGGSADNIPLFAISTGAADGLECVLRKIGINDNQFTNPSGTGRVRFYQDSKNSTSSDTGPGATINVPASTTTPSATQLYDTSSASATPELNNYDAVIFACRGGATNKDDGNNSLVNVLDYANSGGRVFATHYSYVWLDPQSEETTPSETMWSSAADWQPDSTSNAWNTAGSSTTGLVSTTVNGGIFAKWLAAPAVAATAAGSTVAAPLVTIYDPRNDVDIPVGSGTEQWIQYNGTATHAPLMHMAFNTPVGATTQCGRVIYSDFHISVSASTKGTTFPNECAGGAMTAQEKILAYMIFDLTQCITPTTPPTPPPCVPGTCAGIACGPASDGCGNELDCGSCPTGEICTGTPAACVTPPCTKATCPSGGSCGLMPDGCGGDVDCGPCPSGMTCGGAGPSMCGTTTCTPQGCPASIKCGPAADGCGGLIASCGVCPPDETCGGGGTSGVCGKPNCTPRTCADAKANCGVVADGCGNVISCGTCPNGQTCGGGGVANQCSTTIPR